MASRQHPNGIFISYRRADGGAYAGRLYDSLHHQLGRRADLFMDVEKLTPGVDFVQALDAAIARCRVVLVVIDPTWTDARADDGTRRLDDPQDWVRREVSHSLGRADLRVIPVLVGGARMPTETDLPDDLRALARREAFEITTSGWSRDVAALAEQIAGKPSRSPRVALVATAAVLVVAGIVVALIVTNSGGSGSSTTPTTAPPTTTTTTSNGNGNGVPPVSLTPAAPPPAFTSAFQDSMTDNATNWSLADNNACTRTKDFLGLHIAVLEEDVACSEPPPFISALALPHDTSVSVQSHLDSAIGLAPTIDLECKLMVQDGRTTGYAAQYGRHFVQFLRYSNGVFTRLASSTIDQPILHVGDTNQLELQCYSSPQGLVLAFFVDGNLIGATLDPNPLTAGTDVAMRCGTGDNTTASCTFTNFSVRTAN